MIPNAPTDLDMNTFRAKMSKDEGLSKIARFAVRVNPPAWAALRDERWTYNDLTYLCETAEMPGRALMNMDVRHYGPSHKLPYQTVYEDATMTFLCRNLSKERKLFDTWMEVINPSRTYDFNYRTSYATTIEIFQFSDLASDLADTGPKATYAFTLYDAYPIIVSPQQVTWTDDNFQRLSVTFTYTKWRRRGQDLDFTTEL